MKYQRGQVLRMVEDVSNPPERFTIVDVVGDLYTLQSSKGGWSFYLGRDMVEDSSKWGLASELITGTNSKNTIPWLWIGVGSAAVLTVLLVATKRR